MLFSSGPVTNWPARQKAHQMSQEAQKRHADEDTEAAAKKSKLAHAEEEEEEEEDAAPEEVRVHSSCAHCRAVA